MNLITIESKTGWVQCCENTKDTIIHLLPTLYFNFYLNKWISLSKISIQFDEVIGRGHWKRSLKEVIGGHWMTTSQSAMWNLFSWLCENMITGHSPYKLWNSFEINAIVSDIQYGPYSILVEYGLFLSTTESNVKL